MKCAVLAMFSPGAMVNLPSHSDMDGVRTIFLDLNTEERDLS